MILLFIFGGLVVIAIVIIALSMVFKKKEDPKN